MNVSLTVSAKGIQSDIARELKPVEAEAKKAGDAAGKAMGSSISKATGASMDKAGDTFTKFGVGGLAAAGIIGAGLLKAGKSASDLGESVNAVNVTFGAAAGGILKLGEDAATSVGLSNTAFNGLAVQFSSFAETIAGKGGNVVDVMADMTGRAADFASVMNIEVADAAAMFQSGLAGETEPLKKFGLDLSAAAVEAYAAANGIGALGGELTEAEKVQARYGLLMESTSKTQGDFANTADSAANATRIAKAEMENASAALGAALTPAMAFAAGKAADLAKGFTDLNEKTGGWLAKGAGVVAGGLAIAGTLSLVVGQALKMKTRFDAVGDALSTLKGKFTTAEGGMTKFGGAATVAVVGIGIVVAGLFAYQQGLKQAEERQIALTGAINDFTNISYAAFAAEFGATMNKLFVSIALDGANVSDTTDEWAASNLEATKTMLEMATASGQGKPILDALAASIEKAEAKNREFEAVQAETIPTTRTLKNATDEQTAAYIEFSNGMNGTTAALALAREQIIGVAAAHDRAAAASRDYEAAWDSMTGKINAERALINLKTQIIDTKVAGEEALAAQVAANEAIAKGADDALAKQVLADAAQRTYQLSLLDTKDDVKAIGVEIGLLPTQVQTLLDLHDNGKIEEMERRLVILTRNRTINADIILKGGAGFDMGLSGRGAVGTRNATAGAWMTGEEGPEIVNLNAGDTITPTAETMQILGRSLLTMEPANGWGGAGSGGFVVNNYRRDIGVGDLNQVLAMARLRS